MGGSVGGTVGGILAARRASRLTRRDPVIMLRTYHNVRFACATPVT